MCNCSCIDGCEFCYGTDETSKTKPSTPSWCPSCKDLRFELAGVQEDYKRVVGLNETLSDQNAKLQERIKELESLVAEEMEAHESTARREWVTEAKVKELEDSLFSLTVDCRYLSDHEIDGGAPDNRWEDMRKSLVKAEQTLKDMAS